MKTFNEYFELKESDVLIEDISAAMINCGIEDFEQFLGEWLHYEVDPQLAETYLGEAQAFQNKKPGFWGNMLKGAGQAAAGAFTGAAAGAGAGMGRGVDAIKSAWNDRHDAKLIDVFGAARNATEKLTNVVNSHPHFSKLPKASAEMNKLMKNLERMGRAMETEMNKKGLVKPMAIPPQFPSKSQQANQQFQQAPSSPQQQRQSNVSQANQQFQQASQ